MERYLIMIVSQMNTKSNNRLIVQVLVNCRAGQKDRKAIKLVRNKIMKVME